VKTSGSFSTSKVARLIEEAAEERPAVFGYKDLSLMLEMLNALREVLPVDGILCSDATGPGVVGYSEYIVFQPRTYIFPYGYGTLGMGLPAGIGAKIANPDKAVCVLAGDGGFQFTMEELGVACQEKLCIPIIIWDNAGFGEIRLFQEMLHPGKRIAVDHLNPDFVRLASVYGIPGKQVHDGKEMKSALKNALAHRGPSIIVVKSF
jgi:thiamine pyrophosphate-dependent acetolactate synthase large subunit-like protein